MILDCHVKYADGTIKSCQATQKEIWAMLKQKNIVRVLVYKKGRLHDEYIKART